MSRSLSLSVGVVVERVGGELLVVLPGHTDVVKLSGPPADAVLAIQAGSFVDSHDPVVSDLVEMGIVSAPGMSRRGLVKAGAIGVGAGIAVLAMPSAAMAASGPVDGGVGTWRVQFVTTEFKWMALTMGSREFSSFSVLTLSTGVTVGKAAIGGDPSLPVRLQWDLFALLPSPGGPIEGEFDYDGIRYRVSFTESFTA